MNKGNKTLIISIILALLGVILLNSCKARETQKETVKSIEKINSVSLDWSYLMDRYNSLDKGIIYIKEYDTLGRVKKEVIEQKNKVESKEKTETKETYKKFNIYTKIVTTKKQTQSEAVSNWVWFIGFGFVFLYFIIVRFYKQN